MKTNLSLLFLSAIVRITPATADINWPEYNQQCRDDAGPPYLDDEPGVKYHEGSGAWPVLTEDGECAEPLRDACASRPDPKTAYLEGPISCGGNGWYCRIFNDEANGWPNIGLNSDVNFGQCNTTEAFEGYGFDQDGHCHGSSYDNTYYWWIRDHWHRQYNGRVRCCCGWYTGGTQPVTQGRIANRCDYRRLVTPDEDVSRCRDANEDHGLGFEGVGEAGCDVQYTSQIGSPLPEDDSVCWEIQRFGYTDSPVPVPTQKPTITPKPTQNPVIVPDTPPPTVSLGPTPPTRITDAPTDGSPTSKPTNSPITQNPTQSPMTESPVSNPSPGEEYRVVACGRGYDCDEADVDGEYSVVHVDEEHEVRCCRDCSVENCGRQWKQKCEWDPDVYARSKLSRQCYESVNFVTAKGICADNGGRLCTVHEVLEGCTQGTGCGFDSEMIWTCTYGEGDCESDEECCSGVCNEGICTVDELFE